METDVSDIMELITTAPWREAVTYRDTWPHEYVVIQKDAQQELLAAFCERILRGESVECHFFHQTRPYLFLGDYKYWVMDEVEGIDAETYDSVLNRAPLYRDRRDYVIKPGDSGIREEGEAMAEPEEGIVQVEVRDLWPNEAFDFTPWLADNLKLLGEAIGLKLTLVEQEKLIGSMWLDILAKETGSGAPVAIETQLEWTDIDHLGRLLIYAAGCEAKVVIWVAPEFMYEHAQVLHQMNKWAGANASFYGVKVEAIKKPDNLELEPRFLKVVWPNGWNKDITLDPVRPPNPEIQRYRAFYEPLIAKLLGTEMTFAESYRQAFWYQDRLFPSSFDKEIGYALELVGGKAWVFLYLRTSESVDLNNALFDALKKDQEAIESNIDKDGDWEWRRFDRYTFSIISIRRVGSIEDPPEQLEETRTWMLDLLPKFKDTFGERVETLLSELRQSPE